MGHWRGKFESAKDVQFSKNFRWAHHDPLGNVSQDKGWEQKNPIKLFLVFLSAWNFFPFKLEERVHRKTKCWMNVKEKRVFFCASQFHLLFWSFCRHPSHRRSFQSCHPFWYFWPIAISSSSAPDWQPSSVSATAAFDSGVLTSSPRSVTYSKGWGFFFSLKPKNQYLLCLKSEIQESNSSLSASFISSLVFRFAFFVSGSSSPWSPLSALRAMATLVFSILKL